MQICFNLGATRRKDQSVDSMALVGLPKVVNHLFGKLLRYAGFHETSKRRFSWNGTEADHVDRSLATFK